MEHMGLIFLGGVFVSESKTANTSWCAICWFLLNWLSVYSAVPTKQSSTTKHFCNLYQPYYPYHPCMVYSPTFTITIKQRYVNIPFMDPMGYRIHLELQQKCPSNEGGEFTSNVRGSIHSLYWATLIRNPRMLLLGCINSYYWFDDHPLLYGSIMGV